MGGQQIKNKNTIKILGVTLNNPEPNHFNHLKNAITPRLNSIKKT